MTALAIIGLKLVYAFTRSTLPYDILAHIERMRAAGCRIEQTPLPDDASQGTFVAPTIVELDRIDQLSREVFGPVLHVVRFKRGALDELVNQINATGYGLTFGLHTRLDETVAQVTSRTRAGNIYVNRNMIGAVVGVQPFGGCGLSGTGPKAGGPLYLGRLVRTAPTAAIAWPAKVNDQALTDLAAWLAFTSGGLLRGMDVEKIRGQSVVGCKAELPGPVGELNLYEIKPRGRVLLLPCSTQGLVDQVAAALVTGNHCVVKCDAMLRVDMRDLPSQLAERIEWIEDLAMAGGCVAALVEPGKDSLASILSRVAELEGPIPLVQTPADDGTYRLDWLVEEVSTSINTTAAGGNASLMALV